MLINNIKNCEKDYEKDGIYLSRSYYDWLMAKNNELTDRYVTFGELFKAYANSKYKRFIQEQNLMCNEFFYHIKRIDNHIKLERNYDMVFVPYDKILAGYNVKTDIESTDTFLVNYSNICQDGQFPSKCARLHYGYVSEHLHLDYLAYQGFTRERDEYERKFDMRFYEHTVKLGFMEYAMAEENSSRLLGCNLEYTLARRLEANVIRHLMDEAERLYLVNRKKKNYELRLLLFAEGIMLLSTHGYMVGHAIPIRVIQEYVNSGLNKLKQKDVNLTFSEMCKEIRETRKEIIKFRISDQLIDDYNEEEEGSWEFFDCEEETDEFYLDDEKIS